MCEFGSRDTQPHCRRKVKFVASNDGRSRAEECRRGERGAEPGKASSGVYRIRAARWTLKTAEEGFRNSKRLWEALVLCQLRLPMWVPVAQTVHSFYRGCSSKETTDLAAWELRKCFRTPNWAILSMGFALASEAQ